MVNNCEIHIIMGICKMVKIFYYEEALFNKGRIESNDLLIEFGVNSLLFYVLSTVLNTFSLDLYTIYVLDATAIFLFGLGYQLYLDNKNKQNMIEKFQNDVNAKKEASLHNVTHKPSIEKTEYPKVWMMRIGILIPYYLLFI